VKKEEEHSVKPIRTDKTLEETNVIPMKKEVHIESTDKTEQPAKIIFITSGFGKIHVPLAKNTNTSPMAIAA
jgi:hypothetical protein